MNKLDELRLARLEAKRKSGRHFTRYYGALFSAIMVFSIISCVLVLALAHYGNLKGGQYDLFYALAIIPFANAVFGVATRWAGQVWYEREQALINSIERVSQGDFSVRLDTSKADSWQNIYRNFNKMIDDLQNSRMVNENFVKDFSHELKTPIASIHGFAEVLLTEAVSAEEQKQYLQIIASQSARLASLAQNTLMLSKIDSQQFIMAKNTFAMDEQIKQCLILFAKEWRQKNIDFSADLAEISYCGNEELLEQVWINLLGNAGKFTPSGGQIQVTMQKQDEQIVLAFTDSGIGMSEDVQAHIFDKYYQGDRSRSTEGHGLGLAIARRIIRLHGGDITVESAPGAGSTFWVYLPMGEKAPEIAKQPIALPKRQMSGYEQRVRLVSVALESLYLACYEDFGWQVVKEEAMKQQNQVGKKITWQREKFWAENAWLNSLQAQAEEALDNIALYYKRAAYWALAASIGVGLVSSALLAAVIWCLAHQHFFSGTVVFMLSICGCAAAYLLHDGVESRYLSYRAPILHILQQNIKICGDQARQVLNGHHDGVSQE